MNKIKWLGVLVAIVITSWSSELNVNAQAFHRVYSGGLIEQLAWSPSSKLIFNEGDNYVISSSTNSWHQYDPATNTLTQTNQWPLQPTLSAEETALYKPATATLTDSTKLPSFIFASPDDRYMVIASELGDTSRHFPVYLVDRQTQTLAETYTHSWFPSYGPNGFRVVWNRTGTAFVVSAMSPEGGEYSNIIQAHVSNFSNVLTDLNITSTENIVINGHQYWGLQVFSISDDGNSVLMSAIDADRENSTAFYYLIVWNVAKNTTSLIGNIDKEEIRAANFDDGNPDNLLIFNQLGIVHYTISTQHTAILTTQINSDWAAPDWPTQAAFSPDGQWLAVTRADLYVFNLYEDFVGLKVQYHPEASTRVQYSDVIVGQFKVVNTSDVDIDLSMLKLRYFFSQDTPQPLQVACSWANLPNECDDVLVTVGAWPNPYTDSYVEIGFKAGSLPAHRETGAIIVRVNKQDFSDFNQADDYSFDPQNETDSFTDWDSVALYLNGKMVWGIEPLVN